MKPRFYPDLLIVVIIAVLNCSLLFAQDNDFPFDEPDVEAGIESPDVAEPAVVVEAEDIPDVDSFELDRNAAAVNAEDKDIPDIESFDIDRGETDVKAEDVEESEKRRSFFERLFGRRDRDEKPEEPVPDVEEPVPDVEEEVETAELTSVEALARQEEVRRQALEVQAMRSFREADEAVSEGKYDLALKHLSEGMRVMPVRPETASIRETARRKQADGEYQIALRHYRGGRFAEARDSLRRARGYYPADRRPARLEERIRSDMARAEKIAERPVHPRDTEERISKEEKWGAAIRRGRQFMEIREYERAKYEFRSVLMEDPLNEDAIFNLRHIAQRQYDKETRRMQGAQEQMMADVRAAWTPPVRHEIDAPEIRPTEPTIVTPRRRRLMDKLNTIMIPRLDFRQANIVDVIHYLEQQSIAGDSVSPPDERGVNFILNLKRPGLRARERVIEPDPFDDLDSPVVVPGVEDIPLITLSLRNILLIDAIRYITEVSGLRYRIEDDVVMITPEDVVVGLVVTRTYRVQPTITEIIMTERPSDDPFSFDLGVDVRPERADVRSFFVEAGVPFPEGTSIVYKPSINLLIVSNTEENLERFEQILATLDVVPTQVEIEARFVEVGQRDLMELGVEWRLTDNWIIAQESGAGAPIPISARERLQIDRNVVTKGLRHFTLDGDLAPQGDKAGILSISSVLTNPELNFILHALEQKESANVLSAPKVTTKSGSNAEIKVVRELIYPTSFDVLEAPVASGYEGIVPRYTIPSAFDIRDVGVVLNVTPIVAPDGYTIDLTMLPQVVELADWINYGSRIVYPDGSAELVNIPQPIFHSRSIATSISIWDGQTVVMGGLITEVMITSEDKVPFLGDIPLIGALFRSKSSRSEKRNLLIFVTARLVDPAGIKVHTPTAGGPAS